jgi:hypothetical protein
MSQPSSTTAPVKFAYWVPNVSGGLVISNIEQRTNHSAEYNRKLAQIAEKSGFEYALSQIRFTAGYGADDQHESVAFSHDLLACDHHAQGHGRDPARTVEPGAGGQADRHHQLSPTAASPSTS